MSPLFKVGTDANRLDPPRLVILTAGGPLAPVIVNGLVKKLCASGTTIAVIEEQPERKWDIVKRRARLLGWSTALGQAACGMLLRMLAARREERIKDIMAKYRLDPRPVTKVPVHAVSSVNSNECRALLKSLAPDVVAVYGTRLIKSETLNAVSVPFINYHAGINPKYRGQHPGYWALVSGDAENAGVTVHLVDEGVDTGDVLYQQTVRFNPKDNISTYQFVQAAAAIPLFAKAIEDALDRRLEPQRVALPSRQWFPPTLWSYLLNGCAIGIW